LIFQVRGVGRGVFRENTVKGQKSILFGSSDQSEHQFFSVTIHLAQAQTGGHSAQVQTKGQRQSLAGYVCVINLRTFVFPETSAVHYIAW